MSTILDRRYATTKHVIGGPNDLAFIADLQVIAKKEPGKGAALSRMLERADCTHADLAECLGKARGTVSAWVQETRWPDDPTVRNALIALKCDRRMLLDYCGPVITSSNEFDPQALAVAVFTSIFDVDDPFDRESLIYNTLYEKALIAQGIKATSDTRAFVAFDDAMRKHEELKRKRNASSVRDISPAQAEWSTGASVYADPVVVAAPPDTLLTQAASLAKL